jgi:hypothetical protein
MRPRSCCLIHAHRSPSQGTDIWAVSCSQTNLAQTYKNVKTHHCVLLQKLIIEFRLANKRIYNLPVFAWKKPINDFAFEFIDSFVFLITQFQLRLSFNLDWYDNGEW